MLIATIIGCTLLAIVCLGGARILFGIIAFGVCGFVLFMALYGTIENTKSAMQQTKSAEQQEREAREWVEMNKNRTR